MGKKSIAFFLAFVTVSVLAAGEKQVPGLLVVAGGGVLLSREERFPLKAQADGGLRVGAELPLGGRTAARLTLGIHQTLPSSLAGGFAYRGFWGTDLQALAVFSLGALQPQLGLAGGLVARYDRYQYTRLYFFYLGLAVEPLVEIPFPRRPHQALELALPLKFYFRRDLELSASCGLALGWKFYPRRRSAAR